MVAVPPEPVGGSAPVPKFPSLIAVSALVAAALFAAPLVRADTCPISCGDGVANVRGALRADLQAEVGCATVDIQGALDLSLLGRKASAFSLELFASTGAGETCGHGVLVLGDLVLDTFVPLGLSGEGCGGELSLDARLLPTQVALAAHLDLCVGVVGVRVDATALVQAAGHLRLRLGCDDLRTDGALRLVVCGTIEARVKALGAKVSVDGELNLLDATLRAGAVVRCGCAPEGAVRLRVAPQDVRVLLVVRPTVLLCLKRTLVEFRTKGFEIDLR